MATGKEALEKLAELAGKKTRLNAVLSSQNDQAFSLRVSAVHPMQVLENVHQDQVRKAIAKLKDPSPDDEQNAEQEQLSKYFLFTPSEPKLVNLKKDEEEKTIDTELVEVAKSLKLVKAVLNTGLTGDEEEEKRKQAGKTLEEARAKLVEIRKQFKDDADKVGWLKDAKKILEGEDGDGKTLKTRITEADTWEKIKAEYNHLDKALDALEEAAAGLSRITMLYGISPFFLFRLLVQYRIEGKNITDKNRRDVSSEVTEHLNKQEWVRDWLAKQMETIDKAISGWEPKVFFHLKGGRALALLLNQEGENDWDTSIVIDPNLPDDEWYELYNQIHDDVLDVLRTAKQEFLVKVSEKAAELKEYCKKELEDLDEDEDEDEDEDLDDFADIEKETAKAELIDIGIPRRDTIEALEQWHHTKDSILLATKYGAKIPIPGALYYIEEYVVMVREALSNRSPSLHKTAKRIQRLANVLDAKDVDRTIKKVKDKVSDKVVPESLKLLDKKKDRVLGVMTLLLAEFNGAYRLHELAGFAKEFDKIFAKDGDKPEHDDYPAKVTEGKDKYLEDGDKKEAWDGSECDAILEHIAFAQTLSVQFEAHLRARAKYFGFVEKREDKNADKRRKKLGELVKALYTASIFSPEHRYEVQLAVAGSHAAYLHADYSRDFTDKIDKLDPVTLIELRYYCYKKADPKTVLDFFVKEPLRNYIDHGDIKFTRDDIVGIKIAEEAKDDKVEGESVYLTWPEKVKFEDDLELEYKPVVLKISVKQQWPEVSFVWGYPVLSLKDLIRDYVEAAALAGEFETKYRLRDTADALKEMLTHYI